MLATNPGGVLSPGSTTSAGAAGRGGVDGAGGAAPRSILLWMADRSTSTCTRIV